jgi:hypothetical protein
MTVAADSASDEGSFSGRAPVAAHPRSARYAEDLSDASTASLTVPAVMPGTVRRVGETAGMFPAARPTDIQNGYAAVGVDMALQQLVDAVASTRGSTAVDSTNRSYV